MCTYTCVFLSSTVCTSYNLNVTRVYHECVDHEMHTSFCYTCVFLCSYVCFLLHENVRKYTSYVCMYTRFFAHAYACYSVAVAIHVYTQEHVSNLLNTFTVIILIIDLQISSASSELTIIIPSRPSLGHPDVFF